MTSASLPANGDVGKIDRCASVPGILDAVVALTGMRFAAVARVTDTQWIACAVRDDLGFGLKPGGELVLDSTICDEIRQHHQPVVFGHASAHPIFRDHHTPKQYGLESYISVPIFRRDKTFFGTLCAIDAVPNTIDADTVKVDTIMLFAQLIGYQLDMVDDLDASAARLQAFESKSALRDKDVASSERDMRDLLQPVISGLYLLRGCDALPEPDRLVLADMEACCKQIGNLLQEKINRAYAEGKTPGDALA